MFLSITRLRLRSPRYLPLFLWHNELSTRQLVRANGFVEGKLFVDAKRTFWTMTAWQDEASMRGYRNNGAHLKAMPKLLGWCDEAAVTHWHQESSELPDWQEAHQRLVEEGRYSKVNHPSLDHLSKRIAKPRLPSRLERPLRPKSR